MERKAVNLKIMFLLVVHTLCFNGYGQVMITGKVVDKQKQPIFAANIFLESNQSIGSVSDFDGLFALKVPDKNVVLVISYIGYNTRKIVLSDLDLKKPLQIVLTENMNQLSEVVIRADDPISKRFAVNKLSGLDIYLNPASQGDPLKAITVLPSSTTTDESANPALRGSAGNSSIVSLNGVPIYKPVRSTDLNSQGFFSLFNPEIIESQYVYGGNPPLTNGNTIAGLVEIQTSKISKVNQVQLSTSLGSVGGLLATNFKGDKSSMQVYYNHQFSDMFVGIQDRYFPNTKSFSADDAGVNFYQKIGEHMEWKSYHYLIHESYAGYHEDYTYRGDVDTQNARYFTVNSLRYFRDNMSLTLNNGYNYSDSEFNYGNIYSKNRNNQSFTSLNLKIHPYNKLELQLGTSFDYTQNKNRDTTPIYYYAQHPSHPKYASKSNLINKIFEGYVYVNYNLNDFISLSSGMRANIPIKDQKSYVSYQVGVSYSPNSRHSFILGGGKYHSYLSPTYYSKTYALLTSHQVSLDYRFRHKKTTVNAAAYYKREKGIQNSNTIYNILFNKTQTFGLELLLTQEFMKYFKLTLSNTFINQKMYLHEKRFHGQSDLNYFVKSIFEFNNPKLFSIALSYIGRPGTYYHKIIGSTFNEQLYVFEPIYSSELYSEQYKNYNRIDFMISKYMHFKKNALVVFCSVNNIFDIKNQAKDLYNNNYTEKHFDNYQRRCIYFGGVWHFSF